jgi:hypothetical protein
MLTRLTLLFPLLASVAACSNQDSAGAGQQARNAAESTAAESLSAETLVSLQRRVVRVIRIAGSQARAKEVVDQWVFRLRGDDDDSRICVDDESHCITLKQLRDQLRGAVENPSR